ncbi:MAG: methyl-accepting chemotaxis protein [Firmicutes bacterium]|nr:methyl-accepting chemotaxis protein [Bacillota bacterium]
MKLSNLKVGTRLYALIAILSILLIALGALGIWGINKTNQSLETVYHDSVTPLKQLKIVSDMYAINVVDTANKIRNKNISWSQGIKNLEFAQKKISEQWEEYKSNHLITEEKQLVGELEPLIKNADQSINKLAKIIREKDEKALERYTAAELYREIDPVTAKFAQLIDVQTNLAKAEYEHAEQRFKVISSISIVGILGVVLLAFLLSFLIIRSVTKPIDVLKHKLNTLADRGGDLTQKIDIDSKDEIGDLAKIVNKFLSNFRTIMEEVNSSARDVFQTSEQLNSTSQQTSASANETAATMNEMSTTVEQVSSNIQEISTVSLSTSEYANRGSEGIASITKQMNNIASASKEVSQYIDGLSKKSLEINKIVELITNIAEQTNLLALNAAIEAARAGEHGRGFAVVAEEVRTLAEQSTDASKEIFSLITAIQEESKSAVEKMAEGGREVEEGSNVVSEVGESFKEIINSVQSLTTQIQGVASATEQMSSGVQNVAASTEEQTAATEEVSAFAESLSKLADQLNQLVGKFKI